ncbi:hypothetical protein EDB87DRAFT_1583366, partial [Lactarius vividus]
MTSLYNQYYNAVHEAAIYADLWRRVQNGVSDSGTPRATLREILFPPRFENASPPPTYDNQPPTSSDEILLQMPRLETPERQTPQRPTIPQNHPGEDWYLNHPRGRRAYPFYIRINGTPTRMKYIRYQKTNRHIWIQGTMGRGQQVYERILRAPELFRQYPRLTPPQVRIFDNDTAGRPEVDRALLALDDWPVAGEVDYYRTLTIELEEQYNQAARLRQTIADTMAQ